MYIHQRRPPPSSSSKVTSHQRLIFSHAVFSPKYKSTLRNYSSSGKHALNSSSIHCNSATTQRARFIYSLRVPGRVERSRKPLWGAPDNLRGLSCSFCFFFEDQIPFISPLYEELETLSGEGQKDEPQSRLVHLHIGSSSSMHHGISSQCLIWTHHANNFVEQCQELCVRGLSRDASTH